MLPGLFPEFPDQESDNNDNPDFHPLFGHSSLVCNHVDNLTPSHRHDDNEHRGGSQLRPTRIRGRAFQPLHHFGKHGGVSPG
jgi:hypothetical protein